MKAIMIKDEYPDLYPFEEYEVEKVFNSPRGYIMLKNNPRRYTSNCFSITHDGKPISHSEAYRLQQLKVVREKLGV